MKFTITLLAFLMAAVSFSQDEDIIDFDSLATVQWDYYQDSIEETFNYQYGEIELPNSIGKISIPEGYKYLDQQQSEYILTELWGNPPSTSYGMFFKENAKVMDPNSYAFNIEYDEIGYVEDDDADDIDYDELLTEMQSEMDQGNEYRVQQGYEKIELVGWASNPFYDKNLKVLHWAKEIKFENEESNTLNYNIRILGRKGVIIINAIATMDQLNKVKSDIPNAIDMVSFNEGFQYADFDPKFDDVAQWTLGGLVAGKILTKVGFFALIVKFWKIIVVAAGAALVGLRKWFKLKKKNDLNSNQSNLNEET